jgi:hypothetical protein
MANISPYRTNNTDKVNINAQTTSYTTVLTDAGKLITENSASATTVTIPLNSSVSYAIGTVIFVAQLGLGTVTIAGASGVSVLSSESLLNLNGQYAGAALIKTDTNTWLLFGNLA